MGPTTWLRGVAQHDAVRLKTNNLKTKDHLDILVLPIERFSQTILIETMFASIDWQQQG